MSFASTTTEPGVASLTDAELAQALLAADRQRSLAEARELELLGEFDARKAFAVDGALNAAGWLARRGDISRSAAGLMASDARKLRRHPDSMRACTRIGTGRVREFVRRVTERTEAAYVANEADVLAWIARLSVDETIRYARRWNQVHDADGPEPAEEKPSLAVGRSGAGLFGRLALFGDDAAFFSTALDDEVDAIWRTETDDDHLDPTHRRAIALMNLIRKAMGADDRYTCPARPTVVVHMTLQDLQNRSGAGHGSVDPWNEPLPGEYLRRLLCEADLHRFVTAPGSVVLDLGRSERLVKGYQRLAVIARDRHCQFPAATDPRR